MFSGSNLINPEFFEEKQDLSYLEKIGESNYSVKAKKELITQFLQLDLDNLFYSYRDLYYLSQQSTLNDNQQLVAALIMIQLKKFCNYSAIATDPSCP